MKIDIYIKMGFHGNPKGEGSAAAIVECIRGNRKDTRSVYTKGFNDTKNKLALMIHNKSLSILIKPCDITIHIENEHIKYAMENGWVEKWSKNNWIKSNGDPPANIGEWKQLLVLSRKHNITWQPYDVKYDDELNKILKSMEAVNEMQTGT